MKITTTDKHGEKHVRDSKCQHGCGFDAKDAERPLQSITMHETRCKLNPDRKVWAAKTGKRNGTAQPRNRAARQMLNQLRAENHINQRLAQALGVLFPEGVVVNEEFIVWIDTTKKMMTNG